MKRLFFVPLYLFAFCFCITSFAQNENTNASHQQIDSVYYTCSMHPEIHSAVPGNCPKCGMPLMKHSNSNNDSGHNMKMDCGMMQGMDMNHSNMMNHQMNSADSTKQISDIYTCSMHPEIQTSEPGKCPKCEMQLVPVSTPGNKKEDNHKIKMGCGMMHGM